jgi:hypothetical protein
VPGGSCKLLTRLVPSRHALVCDLLTQSVQSALRPARGQECTSKATLQVLDLFVSALDCFTRSIQRRLELDAMQSQHCDRQLVIATLDREIGEGLLLLANSVTEKVGLGECVCHGEVSLREGCGCADTKSQHRRSPQVLTGMARYAAASTSVVSGA